MRKNYSVQLITKSRILKASLLFVFLCAFSVSSYSQLFYTETFDGTACAATSGCDPSLVSWTTTLLAGNGGAANKFYVSCQENGNAAGMCGSGCGSDQSLHVANVSTSTAAPFFCPTGDCGAAFDDSSPAEATNKRVESPTINCTGQANITIAFNYIEQGGSVVDVGDNGSLWYFDGTAWALLNNLTATVNGACSPQGKWTAFSGTLPASADGNPLVKIGFVWTNDGDGNASDPSFAIDDITLTSTVTSNTITTGTIVGSPFCACSTVNVPFTSTGTFTAGNIYTAQLSNAAGSFAAPTTIGTLVSTANTGTIACTIPCATPTGGGYRIRVISSTPAITGSDNGVNLTISAITVPSVTITSVPSPATICAGQSITFTATPVNGGGAPSYQWQINGSNAGTNSPTFTTTSLVNGNVVTVILISSASCPSPATATSTGITVTVNPAVAPSVVITSSPSPATICAGDPVTFTATPTNGGTTPAYQWQVNGTNAGTNSPTFTSSTLVNGDVVTVILTSNAACASPTTATSNSITITVSGAVVASIAITSSPSPAVICAGDPITFTATPTNGGATPAYQWQVNGTNVGTNSPTFTSSTWTSGDLVTVIMTSSSSCATGSPATSNSILVTVTFAVPASVSIVASPTGTICAGQSVTFTATPTNGGGAPSYQWQVNGTNAGTNSPTFTTTTLANGDVVTVIMTSSSSCATGSPATSNSITMTVTTSVVPAVSIAASLTTICSGDPITFTATPTNGGTTPTYQWQVNGTNAGSNSPTFTTSSLNNGDVVTVILTSNATCAVPTTATSNSISIVVNVCTPPVANFTASTTNFCLSGCTNFTDLSTNTPTSWSWSFPGATPATSTAQNPTNICYSATGGYTVILIVTNASGADTLTQVNYITVGMPVPVNITGNTAINACESTTLSAYPADGSYSWGPNVNIDCPLCQSAVVSPTTTQDYYVTYTSPQGCQDSDTITVTVTNIYTYFMPTGFSPNGDGLNDVIQVHGRGIDYINLKIYDRIGEKIFETTDIESSWDGTLHHVAMNDNVFVYMLEVTYCNGEVVKEHGNITLVK